MDNQNQQNNRSSNGAAGEETPEPLYTRFQRETKRSTKKEFFIAKFCPWLFKKSTPTDVQQSTEQGQQPEIPDEAPKPASVDTSIVHGYENEELWLVRCLIKPDDGDFKAIGIFGMPEVGKTALARLVFNNDYVKHYFLPRIWVSVSGTEKLNKQKVVETILRELVVDENTIAEFAQRGVAALLYAVRLKLAGRRYLIVLDGVSKDDDCCRNLISPADDNGDENKYEEFSFAFPKGSGGAVIVTSRRKKTAEMMVGEKEKGQILYTPRPIEDLDSCFSIYNSVLKKKVSTITEDLKKEFKLKSGGLPMAARLMAEIKNREHDGQNEQDHQNVGSGTENNENVPSQDENNENVGDSQLEDQGPVNPPTDES
ncbi:hypothetical protein SLE2022_092040 [Rubroshorea leprosula]